MTPKPSACSVCARDDAADINSDMRSGLGLGTLVKRYGATKPTLGRHRLKCLGIVGVATPAKVVEAIETPPETSRETPETVSPLDRDAEDEATTPHRQRSDKTGDKQPSRWDVPNPGDDAVTAPRKLIAAEVELEVFDLRKTGMSMHKIAKRLGISVDAALDAAERVAIRLRRKTEKAAMAEREVSVGQLDAMLEGILPQALEWDIDNPDGQVKAAVAAAKIIERKSKLLGLDAPVAPLVQINNFFAGPEFEAFLSVFAAALEPWPDAWQAALAAAQQFVGQRPPPTPPSRPQLIGVREIPNPVDVELERDP